MHRFLYVVGSLNAGWIFAAHTQVHDDEVKRRTNAAIAWMQQGFAQAMANGAAGMFLMIHANPRFEAAPTDTLVHQAYKGFIDALQLEVIRFGKPVVLAPMEILIIFASTSRCVARSGAED